MKRIFISLWCSIALMCFCATYGCAESTSCTGTEHEEWTLVTVAGELDDGNYVLGQNVQGKWDISGNVTLCLNGYTLTGNGNESVITIAQNATLNLCDCSPSQSGTITGGGGAKGGGIYCQGTLNLFSGVITGNVLNPHGWGGGVCCEGAQFTMYGGRIEGNTANNGTGVALLSGTFSMYNGEIVNNVYLKPENGIGTYGEYGGIWVSSKFDMYGGTVYGHEGVSDLSVDVCNSSFFNMRGGYVGTVADGYRFSFYGGQVDSVSAGWSMGCTLYDAPENDMRIGVQGGEYQIATPEEAEKYNNTGEVEKFTIFVAGEFKNKGIVYLVGAEPTEDTAVVMAVPLGDVDINPDNFRAWNSTSELAINRYGQLEKRFPTPTPTTIPTPTLTPTATPTESPAIGNKDYGKTKAEVFQNIGYSQGSYKYGDTGSVVEFIQDILKRIGLYEGNVLGNYGYRTQEAVQAFQKQNRLAADGVCGYYTINLLVDTYLELIGVVVATPTPTSTPTPSDTPTATSTPTITPMPNFPNLGDIFENIGNAGTRPIKRPTLILSEDGHKLLGVGFLSFEVVKIGQQTITYEIGLHDAWIRKIALPSECRRIFPYPEGITINNHHGWRVTITHYGEEGTEIFSSEDNTIEFLPLGLCIRVSSLSPFVIEWEKNVVPDNLPQTGDDTSIPLYAMGLLVSLAAIHYLKRKKARA